MKKYKYEDTADFQDIELSEKIFKYLEKVGFSETDLEICDYGNTCGTLNREYVSNETYFKQAKIVVRIVSHCRNLNWAQVAVKCYIRRPDEVIPIFDVANMKNIATFLTMFNWSTDLSAIRSRWGKMDFDFYSSSDNLSV